MYFIQTNEGISPLQRCDLYFKYFVEINEDVNPILRCDLLFQYFLDPKISYFF